MTDDPFRIWKEPMPSPRREGDEGSPETQGTDDDVQRLQGELADARLAMSDMEKADVSRWDDHLSELLEVIDAFERVFDAIHEKEDQVDRQMKIWVGNFRTVKRLLDSVLEAQGVRAAESPTGEFDPKWHKASGTVEDPSKPDGTIVKETRKGYLRNHGILRKAEVVVVRNGD